jgi:hypothetical protein
MKSPSTPRTLESYEEALASVAAALEAARRHEEERLAAARARREAAGMGRGDVDGDAPPQVRLPGGGCCG